MKFEGDTVMARRRSNPMKNQVMAYKPTLGAEVPLEEDEAVALANWMKLKKIPHTHVPLEGKMRVQYMKKLAAMGCSKGFPDYIVFTPGKVLLVELKRRVKITKTGKESISHTKISPEQQDWIDTANCYDYCEAKVCYGWNEAQQFISKYMP